MHIQKIVLSVMVYLSVDMARLQETITGVYIVPKSVPRGQHHRQHSLVQNTLIIKVMTHVENNQEASKALGERGSLEGIRSLVSIVEIITPPWLRTIFCLGKTFLSYAMNLRTALPFVTLAILENMAGVSPKRAFKN